MMKKVIMVLAIGEKGELGKDNTLLWKQKADMDMFRNLTTGGAVIMGRNTWDSIPEKFRPLPNRVNVVVTSRDFDESGNAIARNSLMNAIRDAKLMTEGDIFIIGGAQLYREALGVVDGIRLTIVHQEFPDADVIMPEMLDLDLRGFNVIGRGDRMPADDKNQYDYTFVDYEC